MNTASPGRARASEVLPRYSIEVSGEVELYNAHRLKEVVIALMQKKVRVFILNLKGVTYIDSSGVAALLSINAMLAHEGMQFRIVSVSRRRAGCPRH